MGYGRDTLVRQENGKLVIGTSLFNGVIIEVTRCIKLVIPKYYAMGTDDDGFTGLNVFIHSYI